MFSSAYTSQPPYAHLNLAPFETANSGFSLPFSEPVSTANEHFLSTQANRAGPSAPNADSSIDINDDDGEGAGKRRRVQRACDTCRKKKIRCDGLQPEKGACSNCASYGYECTFVDAARKRAPPRSYVEALEARMARMESLLDSLAPGVDFTARIGKPVRRPDSKIEEEEHVKSEPNLEALKTASPATTSSQQDLALRLSHSDSICEPGDAGRLSKWMSPAHEKTRTGSELSQYNTDEESEDGIGFIEAGLTGTHLTTEPGQTSSWPMSASTERFIISDKVQSDAEKKHQPQVHKFIGKASSMHVLPLIEKLSSKNQEDLGLYPKGARPEFWHLPAGLLDAPADPALVMGAWPDEDLATLLIDAYFDRSNRDFPIMNEAQYRHEYANKPELRRDPEWLALSFAIFMVASHYVIDDRVKADPADPHSRGLQWWHASKTLAWRNHQTERPLSRIQNMLLCTLFQIGTPISASAAWMVLGHGIRLLLDIGAHRKQTARKLGLSRVDEESFKRVFWVAYSLDRECSSGFGRPVMLQDEDIDLELPLEIDDGILFTTADTDPLPEQPKKQPAAVSGFLCSLRLDELVGRTLKLVYALNKTKVRFGYYGKEWDERIVTEIDAALNRWLETVPEHLRYDPFEPNDEWLIQSSILYAKYYNCQILVHRPYIPARRSSSAFSILNFPSLAICTNAARSISHLVSNLKDRNLHNNVGVSIAFRSSSAAGILLMVIWGAKRNGGRVSSSASTDLRRSIDVMKAMEGQWQVCGKLVDVLESLIASTHLLVPHQAPPDQGHKRSRDGNDIIDSSGNVHDASLSSTKQDSSRSDAAGRAVGDVQAEAAERVTSSDLNNLRRPSRTLPLSTQQLASMQVDSSAEEESPSSMSGMPSWNSTFDSVQTSPVNNQREIESMFGSLGPMTPQQGRERFPSISGSSGVPPSFSFGMLTPSLLNLPAGNVQSGLESDYLYGPHSQAVAQPSLAAVTPSLFDNFNMPSAGVHAGMVPDFGGFSFDNVYNNQPLPPQIGEHLSGNREGVSGDTPSSDGGNIANYAYELLQKQSLWVLDDESFNALQHPDQRR